MPIPVVGTSSETIYDKVLNHVMTEEIPLPVKAETSMEYDDALKDFFYPTYSDACNNLKHNQNCLGLWCLMPLFQQYFSCIVSVSSIDKGNQSTKRKPATYS
jgi:hypothetical protein